MAKKIKKMGRFTHTKGVGALGERYDSGGAATVVRKPAFEHGRLLREGRKNLGMSQGAVANLIGRNVSEVSRAESSSDYYPRLVNLVKHLDALNMRVAIIDQNGVVHELPTKDFLWADGSPKSLGAKAKMNVRRSKGKK